MLTATKNFESVVSQYVTKKWDKTLKGISIPFELDSVQKFVIEVSDLIKEHQQFVDDIFDFEIQLGLTEVINNLIIHGKLNSPDQALLFIIHGKTELVLHVCDHGTESFDAQKLDPPQSDPMQLAESGRGLMIISKVFDQVSYKTFQDFNDMQLSKLYRRSNPM